MMPCRVGLRLPSQSFARILRRVSVAFFLCSACGLDDTRDATTTEPDAQDAVHSDAAADAEPAEVDAPDGGAADAVLADASERPLVPASDPGGFSVGFREITASYEEPITGERREIPVSLWYPTTDDSGTAARYQDLFRRDHVFADAALAEVDRPFPVMVFSHGNSSLPEQNFFMSEHWASHGWVVAAPEHVGNSFFDGEDDEPHAFYRRPLDVTATLDALYALSDSDPLSGRLSDDVALSGHSFGGYTTLAVVGAGYSIAEIDCESRGGLLQRNYCVLADESLDALLERGFLDERVDVAISQTPAGALFFAGEPGRDGLSQLAVPTMLMTADRDQVLPDEVEGTPIWESIVAEGNVRFHMPEAGHFTFSNMCEILPGLATDDGCGEDFVGHEIALPAINTYALSFARWVLWADEPSRRLIFDEAPPAEVSLSFR